jgi:hypothetical protein
LIGQLDGGSLVILIDWSAKWWQLGLY